MNSFTLPVEIRWSDLDPNFHLRHSVYYDLGAYSRINYLNRHGITAGFMREHHFGPIIFREEALFRKELKLEDSVTIDVSLMKASRDFGKWTMQHNIYKNGDTLSAIITLDGAWIDIEKRKLTIPPAKVMEGFEEMPKAVSFEWIEKKA
ncbi:MAG: thioesterase family protein [Gemmatimonadaceae bacterium]|nr:thioesterase family protein [Chitinophagaceae bacterium]